MRLLASVITSMRLAVKLAIYKTPRDSSSARSDASPPIGTTVPNVAAVAVAATIVIVNPKNQGLRNILFDSISPELTTLSKMLHPAHMHFAVPRLFAPAHATAVRAGGGATSPRRAPPGPLTRFGYSTFFLRRSTMTPRNRIASTAHTIRTV